MSFLIDFQNIADQSAKKQIACFLNSSMHDTCAITLFVPSSLVHIDVQKLYQIACIFLLEMFLISNELCHVLGSEATERHFSMIEFIKKRININKLSSIISAENTVTFDIPRNLLRALLYCSNRLNIDYNNNIKLSIVTWVLMDYLLDAIISSESLHTYFFKLEVLFYEKIFNIRKMSAISCLEK